MMQDDHSAEFFVGIGVGVYRITSANWFDDILTPAALWMLSMNKDRHGNKLKCQVSELIMENNNQHDIL